MRATECHCQTSVCTLRGEAGICPSSGLFHSLPRPAPASLLPDDLVDDVNLFFLAAGVTRYRTWTKTFNDVAKCAKLDVVVPGTLGLIVGLPPKKDFPYLGTKFRERGHFLTYAQFTRVVSGDACTPVEAAALEWQASHGMAAALTFKSRCFLFAVWLVAAFRLNGHYGLRPVVAAFSVICSGHLSRIRCGAGMGNMEGEGEQYLVMGWLVTGLGCFLSQLAEYRLHALPGLAGECQSRCPFAMTPCRAWA